MCKTNKIIIKIKYMYLTELIMPFSCLNYFLTTSLNFSNLLIGTSMGRLQNPIAIPGCKSWDVPGWSAGHESN